MVVELAVAVKSDDYSCQARFTFLNPHHTISSFFLKKNIKISDNNALARPWSKHSRGSSAYEKMQSNVNNNIKQSTNTTTPSPSTAVDGDIIAKASESGVVEDVEKLNEFMQVMQPRSQTRTWGNDDVAPNAATASLALPSMVKSKEDINYQDLGEVEAKKLEEEEEALLLDLEAIEKEKLNTAAHNQQLSDLDYFKSKMTGSLDAVEEEVEKVQIVSTTSTTTSSSTKKPDEAGSTSNAYNPASSSATHATTNITAAAVNSDSSPLPPPPPLPMFSIVEEDEEPPPADLIADTGRLLVQNISYLTTTDELTTLFAKYGPLSEVHIPIEKSSKRSLGYAFVMFLLPEHAVKAFIELDGSIFQGRILTVLPAKEKPRPKDEVELESLSFKERRAREQKKNAAKTEYSWNSLFMNVNRKRNRGTRGR